MLYIGVCTRRLIFFFYPKLNSEHNNDSSLLQEINNVYHVPTYFIKNIIYNITKLLNLKSV